MNKLRAILVDDEKNNCENLKNMLARYCKEVEVMAICYNAFDGYEMIVDLQPDLLFLDVEMPGGTGFDLLERLPDQKMEVVFVTAYDQYAIKALRLCALDYILKPIDPFILVDAVKRASKRKEDQLLNKETLEVYRNNRNEQEEKKIVLPTAERDIYVKICDIVRCQGDSNYTHVVMNDGSKVIVSRTLKEFDELLSENNFIRVHLSHLVSVNYISSFEKREGGYLKLSNNDTVPISRQRKEKVLAVLKR